MLIVALGWSLLEAIRQRWSTSWKTPSNRRIHPEMYIHTIGGLSTSRTNKEKVEQIFQSWRDNVHWNDRVRQNCCQLEELGMSPGALALPVCGGGTFYPLWHCAADVWRFSVAALTVGERWRRPLPARSRRQDVMRSKSPTTNLTLVGGQQENIIG